ncbi:alpha/beta fold hydrolase [Hydrogenophaga sp.]|uniref:alpha/beta fold hydrolase n=1 Tax=Hydrogenophaga sp. TaxID=1904254 RepID=UPI003F717E00
MAQTLEWREAGIGTPLLLVHGIQGTADAWSPLLPSLSAWRCVLPNLPGRGLSPRWNKTSALPRERYYHLDHYADLIQALLQKLRQKHESPVSLAGWSMGVSVILNLLARHGDADIDRLVLISGTACATPGAVWFQGETPASLAAEARERAQRLGLKAVADADAVAATWASVRGADLREAARAIRRPTLVVHGEHDDQCPLEHGLWLAANVPQARWLPLAGVGHAALGACPADLGSSMSAFLRH